MEQTERLHLHESCVVPYRHGERGVEFCLVSQASGNRWEFPTTPTAGDEATPEALLEDVAAGTGLHGHLDGEIPLDAFVAARGNESRRVTAYLMQVTLVDNDWPKQSTHRRLWCLAEEARLRLRRKPFRRFIDQALRWVGPARPTANGTSQPSGRPRNPR
jgi:hypothetical protein